MMKENFEYKKRTSATMVAENIKRLMINANIKEADLARQTGLPQTTINRLLLSETRDPRANTLIPIAKFFNLTVGQLLGEEPMLENALTNAYNLSNRNVWKIVPIISWEDVLSWRFQKEKFTPLTHAEWLTTERKISDHTFALRAKASMEPRFPKNALLIIEPEFEPQDGHFVIVSFTHQDPTVRQIMHDGGTIFLKKLYDKKCEEILNNQVELLGTIIETRINEK